MPGLGWGSADLDSAWLILDPGCKFTSAATPTHLLLILVGPAGSGRNARGKVSVHLHVSSLCLHMSAKITVARALYGDKPNINKAENRPHCLQGGTANPQVVNRRVKN